MALCLTCIAPPFRVLTNLSYVQESVTVLPVADGRAVVRVQLAPNLASTGEENFVAAALIIRLPAGYPQELPELVVEKIKGLSHSQLAALLKRLELKVIFRCHCMQCFFFVYNSTHRPLSSEVRTCYLLSPIYSKMRCASTT